MKEGKNTFKHEPSMRKRKNRLLKIASKGFVHTLKTHKGFVHTRIKPCVHTKKNT